MVIFNGESGGEEGGNDHRPLKQYHIIHMKGAKKLRKTVVRIAGSYRVSNQIPSEYKTLSQCSCTVQLTDTYLAQQSTKISISP
jgi:hypothetical protein